MWSRAGEFGPAELRLRHPEDPCPTTRALEVQPTRAGTTGVLIDQRAQTSRGQAGQAVLKVHEGGHGEPGEALARCAPAPGGRLRHCGTGLTVAVCCAPAGGAGAVGADARPAGGFHLRRGGRVRAPPYRRAHGNAGRLDPPPRPKSNEASGGARIYSCVRPLTRSSRMRKMPAN